MRAKTRSKRTGFTAFEPIYKTAVHMHLGPSEEEWEKIIQRYRFTDEAVQRVRKNAGTHLWWHKKWQKA